MRYRRRNSWSLYSNYSAPSKIEATVTWDNLTNATYNVRFNFRGTEQWKIVEQCAQFIKATIPSSQREYVPETKTWVIGESQIKPVLELLEAIPNINVTFVEKPAEQAYSSKFIPKEVDFAEFKRLLSFAQITFDAGMEDTIQATKAFRKAAMKLHPDINPDMADTFSSLNSIYTRLFKSTKMEQIHE